MSYLTGFEFFNTNIVLSKLLTVLLLCLVFFYTVKSRCVISVMI